MQVVSDARTDFRHRSRVRLREYRIGSYVYRVRRANVGYSGGAIAGWVSQYIGRRLTIMYVSPTLTRYRAR